MAPSFVITKSIALAQSYDTYHVGTGNTVRLNLNSTNAASAPDAKYWNNTTPSSTVVTIGTTTYWGSSVDYIAYCFAPIAGYSAFGSYTGNASADGPFIYLGFRPRYVLFKNSSSAVSWNIFDTARDPYNVATHYLGSSNGNAEGIFTTFDMLSNGFKIRTTDADTNGSGSTITYAAFAENPFNNSLAR